MALPPLPLIIFCFTIFFVILSVLNEDKQIRIPFVGWTYTVRFYRPPLIGVLILLILSPTSGSLQGIDLWKGGFAGDGKVFPYHTMVQFETLAFVCIALDMTGILAYIALKAIQAAGSSGRKLFFYFFFLSSAFTICTSNDIVILTLTPIIYYCTKVAKISPYPMLFSEFFTANICSMTLVIGNPVNLIVANANNLSFAGYSNFMAAPAIIGSMTCCVIMYLLNRKDIDVTFTPPELDPDACLKDRRGVVYHGVVLFLTRVFLGVSDNLHAEGWIICTVAAGFSFLYNLYFWPWDLPAVTKKDGGEELELMVIEKREPSTPVKGQDADKKALDTPSKVAVDGELGTPAGDVVMSVDVVSPSINTEDQTFQPEKRDSGDSIKLKVAHAAGEHGEQEEKSGVSTEMPTSKKCILNCPWAVLPFVYGMFTLVSGLKKAGWIDAFAHEILNAIPSDEGNSSHAIITATYLMATISFVLCCLLDNQPASILLTQVLISPVFSTLPTYVRTAGMLGVLEGANVGGCWSLMGALAGIMWATLLRNKGIHIGYIQFMKVALRVMPVVTFMIAFIIFLECTGKAHQ